MEYTYHYESPLGKMIMSAEDNALTGLWFGQERENERTFTGASGNVQEEKLPVFVQTCRWLNLYFAGEIPDFLPKLQLKGTEFRQRVWEILLTIPYGETMTYGEIADMIARERGRERMSAQAVGGAVGHNPIPILVPCHRVLGAGRRLTGYTGGIEKKIRLLQIENIEFQE